MEKLHDEQIQNDLNIKTQFNIEQIIQNIQNTQEIQIKIMIKQLEEKEQIINSNITQMQKLESQLNFYKQNCPQCKIPQDLIEKNNNKLEFSHNLSKLQGQFDQISLHKTLQAQIDVITSNIVELYIQNHSEIPEKKSVVDSLLEEIQKLKSQLSEFQINQRVIKEEKVRPGRSLIDIVLLRNGNKEQQQQVQKLQAELIECKQKIIYKEKEVEILHTNLETMQMQGELLKVIINDKN